MKKRTRLVIIVLVILIIIALIIGIVIKSINKKGANENAENNTIDYEVKDTGKLEEYIKNMGNNYYIKYSGKFKDNNGNYVQTVIEYTKDQDNFALRSSDLNMHIICEKERLYTISSRYKLIVEIGKDSFNTDEYNLASDIGQVFVKAEREKVSGTEYDVEEYLYNGKNIRYYFKEGNLRFIRYDGQEIRIIRLEKESNKELLTKPSGYKYAIS